MNKEIFSKVLNNQSLHTLIFNHISRFKKPTNIYCNEPKNYKWKDLIETPHVMLEYGYLDLFRQFYKKYYKKYPLCLSPTYKYHSRFIDTVVRLKRKDVYDFLFKELKVVIKTEYMTYIMIYEKQWELLDHVRKICPESIFPSNLLFIFTPYYGLDRLKQASSKEKSLISHLGVNIYDNVATLGRVDMLDWLLKNRSKKEIEGHQMYDFATKAGHIHFIQYLIDNNIKYKPHTGLESETRPPNLIELAVKSNQLETLKYICANQDKLQNSLCYKLLDFASGSDIEMLDWLNANRSEHCTHELLTGAVKNGRLDIIQWAHFNRPDRFHPIVMDTAAANGFLDILIWLHENRPEGCTTNAMDDAASNGHLRILNWLHKNRSEGCTTRAMDNAASNDHLEVVIWLHENRTEGCTTDAIDIAASHGHLDIIKWLHKNRTEGGSSLCLTKAASGGHMEVMEWLYEHSMGNPMEMTTHNVMFDILTNGHFKTFKWICEHVPLQNNLSDHQDLRKISIPLDYIVNQTNLDFYRWFIKLFSLETLKKHKSLNQRSKTLYSDVMEQTILEMEASPKQNCIIN